MLTETLFALHQDIHWAADVQRALEDDRLWLCAQQIFTTRHGEQHGERQSACRFELLLRMRDLHGRMIEPDRFLPVLERYGLAAQLDRWVIINLLDWLQQQQDRLDKIRLCAINLSAASLNDDAFIAFLLKKLSGDQRLAGKICFEIKEATLSRHRAKALRFVRTLSACGCRFTLEEFGNNWHSLRHLKDLPFELVKISGTLIGKISEDRVDYTIVKAIIDAAQFCGKRVIAPWIENETVYQRLSEAGVDLAQGYHLARPKWLGELRV